LVVLALTLALVSLEGRIVSRRDSSADGVASVSAGDYSARLAALAGDWIEVAEAVYVAGMPTARGNWSDTGYVQVPA